MDETALPSRALGRRRRGTSRVASLLRALLGLLLVGVVAAGGAVLVFGPQALLDRLPLPAEAACAPARVTLSADPSIAPTVTKALRLAQGQVLSDGSCLDVDIVSQEPARMLAGVQVLPQDRWPQLWVPDSSAWAAQGAELALTTGRSLATSPVLLGTSRKVVTAQGWAQSPPTWAQALTGPLPLAAPDLAQSTEALSALVAVRGTTGEDGERAVAASVLATQRISVKSVQEAIELGVSDSASAPLVPVSEQTVIATNLGVGDPTFTPVYPTDGSPYLDFPLLRLGAAQWGPHAELAAAAVTAVLDSPAFAASLSEAGFRSVDGLAPAGADVPAAVAPLKIDAEGQFAAVAAQLRRLATPTRMLVLIDVSASMKRPVTPGLTRIALVQAAAAGALQLLPPTDMVGLWSFAGRTDGRPPFAELAPTQTLGQAGDAQAHRRVVAGTLAELPELLRTDGTAIYASTLAAVDAVQEGYDPKASNVVVLLTDGSNEDEDGPSLAQAVEQLTASAASPSVRLIAVGISRDADLDALRKLVAATPNGKAYLATSPAELRTVLFDAISSR